MKNTFRMVASAATALAIGFSTMQANAQVAYFEDFNGKSTADLESAGWVFEVVNGAEDNDATAITVEFGMDRTRDQNPVGPNGLPTTGEYLMSDADRFGDGDQNLDIDSGQSYDATTPSIDCSGLSQVLVSADLSVILNNNGSAVFMIDVSVGGGEWITKETRVAPSRFPGETFADDRVIRDEDPFKAVPGKDGNMGAIHGRHYIDITAEAAGQSDVRLRFRHYEEDWDWWIAIDNLEVSSNAIPQGSEVVYGPITFDSDLDGLTVAGDVAIGDPFAHKDAHFVAGDPSADPDYIVYSENGGEQRHLDGRSLNRLAGQGYAIFLGLGEGLSLAGDFSTLDTPSIDCSAFTEVYYYAWVEFLSEPNMPCAIQVSTDGGSTFEDLYVTASGLRLREDAYAMELYLPVPQAAGQSNVVFRAQAEVLADGAQAFFAIDDITVTGGTGTAVGNWSLF